MRRWGPRRPIRASGGPRSGQERIQLQGAGIPYTHLDGRMRSLIKALRSEQPRLLHTHGYKAGILGRPAARLAGIPVVSTFHSGERGAFPVSAYDWLDEWTSFLGQNIAVSARIRDRLPFAATVIPSYVTTSPTPPTGALPPAAAFVGRLSAEKGPDLFCKLAAGAPAGIAWHIWGDGPMRAALEAKYAGVVRFHGVATDMEAIWPRVGLLVMPSHSEGVPLAALEAAAHGVPVLASRVGGLPTVILDGCTGWLFPAGDIDGAGGALQGLNAWQAACLSDVAALRTACWERARSEFSEQRWLPAVQHVYRSVGVQ